MRRTIVLLLYVTAFVPLIQLRGMIAGATAGKIFLFRAIMEVALILIAIQLIQGGKLIHGKAIQNIIRHPIAITLTLFLASMAISTAFSTNPTRAFWGTIERGEGVFGILHYAGLFFFVAAFLSHKERITLLKLFLISGYILLFYGASQSLDGLPRPPALIGNSAFFAGHLLFVIAAAWIVLKESAKKSIWWYAAGVLIPLSAGMIALTRTRGAVLGLGVGIAIYALYKAYTKFGKKIIGAIALLVLVAGTGLWIGRSRLVGLETLLAPTRGASTLQTRFAMWQAGLDAFKEKPVIGWGPEHFIEASSVHYNPKTARYGETWFDRAHNKIVDVAVAQGTLGTLAFLGLIAAVLWNVRRDETYKKYLTLAFGGAYLTNTSFVLDQTVSWIGLAVFVGWLIGEREETEHAKKQKNKTIVRIGAVGIALLSLGALYYGNWVPYKELRLISEAQQGKSDSAFLDRVFASKTFINAEAKARFIDDYKGDRKKLITQEPGRSMVRNGLKRTAKQEPQNPQHAIRYIDILIEQAAEDDGLYRVAEEELKKLLKRASQRQEVYYLLARVTGAQGKKEEAAAFARKAVELDPQVARAHYVLGLALVLTDDEASRQQGIEELTRAEEADPALTTLTIGDRETMMRLYASQEQWERVANLVLKMTRGEVYGNVRESDGYRALLYFAETRNKKAFQEMGEYMQERYPEKKEDMRALIGLMEQGEWDIIQSTFEFE